MRSPDAGAGNAQPVPGTAQGMSYQCAVFPRGCSLLTSPSSPSEMLAGCPCQGLIMLLIHHEAKCTASRDELLHPLLLCCATGAFSVQHLQQPARSS